MPELHNLRGHFLVAMPSMQDATFVKAVVYIYEHSEEGAMGFIINKPLNVTLGTVLQHVDILEYIPAIDKQVVLMGGPVGQEHGFVLHDDLQAEQQTDEPVLCVSASREILLDIAQKKGPNHYAIVLGYSGWAAEQLEAEVANNDWLVVPYHQDILFDTPIEQRWHKTAALLGVDINRLSGQIGHV